MFWFFRGSGRVDPAKPGSFSQFGVFFGKVPLKNKVLPPDTVGFDGSSRDNWCYAWGSWGFPGDAWIWDLDWVHRPVDPTTWDILGRVPLKNQVLPPDTGKGVLTESGPTKTLFFSELVFWFFRGSGRVAPAKPGSFSQFGVFFGRVPLKNKVVPPDTVGFDGSSRDNWCYAWGSWGFPGDVWIWELDWVRAGVWFFRAIPCKTINIFICINQYMQFAAFIISSVSLVAFIEPCFGQHFKNWQTQLRVPN